MFKKDSKPNNINKTNKDDKILDNDQHDDIP